MPCELINGTRLHYDEAGHGKAIIFLHGYTGSSRDWEHQVQLFSKRWRIVAVDQRGHGRSSDPSEETDYSIPVFSADIFELLKKLSIEKCCLIGHSMGGFVALQFTLDHPELVAALVLVDTSSGPYDTPPGYAELRARLDELAANEGLEAAFEYDAAHNPIRKERFRLHPEQREVAKRKVLNTSVNGYIYVARSFGNWKPVTDHLWKIKAPTLIFWGEEDTPFQGASLLLNKSIERSKLIAVPGAGHSPHEETPDLFNRELLKFLEEIQWGQEE
ncbi:MAG: alpha/beta hydrolase [Syntrophales bacterium]|jgi:2-succinyl-6-hydroxy-2,4-cyclohexadiene-1-carboxylate synthase|nr:alpha/beta hydrolase [Syntrophales bacterium]MDY0043408.1 alpha/beta hydrolase [Syntrophales bacterium]